MDYEAIFRLPRRERMRICSTLTPEQKSELFHTRLRTWREAHRSELSPEQISILDEHLDYVKPELYRRPRTEEPYRDDLLERTARLLGFDRMAQALTLDACDAPDFRPVIELHEVPNTKQFVVDLHITSRFSDDIDAIVRLPAITHRAHLTATRKQIPNPANGIVRGLLPAEGPDAIHVTIQSDPPDVPLWAGARVVDTRTDHVTFVHPVGHIPRGCE